MESDPRISELSSEKKWNSLLRKGHPRSTQPQHLSAELPCPDWILTPQATSKASEVGEQISFGTMANLMLSALVVLWSRSWIDARVVRMRSSRMTVPVRSEEQLGHIRLSRLSIRGRLQISRPLFSRGVDMAFGDVD